MIKRLCLLLILSILAVGLQPRVLNAEGVSYEINSSYSLREKTVAVRHSFALTGDTALESQSIKVPGASEEFRVEVNGASIDYEAKESTAKASGISYSATEIAVDLGSSRTANVSVSYNSSELFGDYARARSLFAPPFELSEITSQDVTLSAELDLAIGNIIGVEAKDISTEDNQQTYSFSKSGGFDEPIVLQMGSLADADVEISGTLQNDSFWWKTKSIVLPLDTNQQRSFIESIEPKPSSIRVDKDGNIVASYFLPPKQSVDVKAKASVLIEQKSYDIKSDGGFEQLDQDIVADYTGNTSLWPKAELDNLGLNKDELRLGTVLEAVAKINEALIEKDVEFTEEVDFTNRIGNENKPKLSSLDYADKMVGTMRAAGVPARVVGGVITDNQLTRFDQTQFQVWVEVFVPNQGWMTVDPALNRVGSNFFGQSGLQRVALFIWGVNDHIPEFEGESVKVSYAEQSQPEEKFSAESVNGTNYMLLPGISILHTSANMPKGFIHDEVIVSSNGSNAELGSLGPLQKTNSLQLIIGDKSWQEIPLELKIAGQSKAKSIAGVSFLSTIAVFVLLILLIRFMIKWYKKSKAPLVINEDNSQSNDIESQNMFHSQPVRPEQSQAAPRPTQTDDDRLRTRPQDPNKINF